MNKNVLVIGTGVVIVLMIITLVIFTKKSTFIDDILTNNYGSCTRDDRNYPQGKVPGSYLTLTPTEKNNMFVQFINNDPNKMI